MMGNIYVNFLQCKMIIMQEMEADWIKKGTYISIFPFHHKREHREHVKALWLVCTLDLQLTPY